MRHPNCAATKLAFAVAGFLACSNAAFAVSFQGLGFLPGGSSHGNQAYAVSADGNVVVGNQTTCDANNNCARHGFRWSSATGMVNLGFLVGNQPSLGTGASAVSADGSVIAGSSRGEAFRWTQATGMVGIGDLPGGLFESNAYGISADGSVVVGQGNTDVGDKGEAFRWTQATGMVGLGDLPGGATYGFAQGVSGDGLVVVGASASEFTTGIYGEPFRWTAETGMVGLGGFTGGSAIGTANAISFDGQVIVGGTQSEAFRWTQAGGMTGLGDLPGGSFNINSDAKAVSGNGAIIVGSGNNELGSQAFLWTQESGMRSLFAILTRDFRLNLTGWNMEHATGISADGRTVVGIGVDPDGNAQAWRATLPDPPTFAGDANNDGNINFIDLGYVLNNFNQPGTYDDGDFNNSGLVDFVDLGILLNNYLKHAPVLSPATTVPEPSTLVLVASGAFAIAGLRVRRMAR